MKIIFTFLTLLVALTTNATSLQLVTPADVSFAPPASGGGDSTLPILSADGRYVLFASTANNLAVTANNTPYQVPQYICLNTYLHDRASNTTILVSVNLAGTGGEDRNSLPVSISTNGQYVLYVRSGDNLVLNATNAVGEVFVRDVVNGLTTMVSVNTNGTYGNGDSYDAAMTPDGRYVAFVSTATDLVADDTNGIADVFVRDLQGGTTTLASVGAMSASISPINISDTPAITPDGRYVAFYSSATNLVPAAPKGGDVYVRDLVGETTTWASFAARSLIQWPPLGTNAASCNLHISDDGNYVAFETCSNLTTIYPSVGIILRYNVATGFTDLVGTNTYVPMISAENIQNLSMSPDGRFIAYVADNDNSGTNTAIYLWDAQSGNTTLISADTSNDRSTNSFCDAPMVSFNGQYVAFLSDATGLATNALGSDTCLYLRNVAAGTTTLVNANTNGVSLGDSTLLGFQLSPDAQFIAFASQSSDLVANDSNHDYDVFLNDTSTGTTELISARQPALPSYAANGYSILSPHSLSQDGRYLVFSSDADNLVPGDTNGLRDVFVRDLLAGTNSLVSIGIDGSVGDNVSFEPAISGNGRYVVFTSAATNLIAGDTNNSTDIFVRDLSAQTTSLVSVDSTGFGMGRTNSYSPAISSDGRFVLFVSRASNLTAGPFSGTDNLFLRDLLAGTNYALTTAGQAYASMTPDGHFIAYTDVAGSSAGKIYVWDSQQAMLVASNTTAAGISSISISPDGNRIAYLTGSATVSTWDQASNQIYSIASGGFTGSHVGLRFSADGRFLTYALNYSAYINQVYLYDFQQMTNILISHDANSSALGIDSSDSPDISADGHFVIYRSSASNLVAGDTNGVSNIFIYDTESGTNSVLSPGINGSVLADSASFMPMFSGDGHTLVFGSWASDLIANDFNQSGDLFALTIVYTATITANGGNPTISWPAAPDKTYGVEYKDNLTDPVWQPVSGVVTIVGNQASLMDTTLISGQRFYRVVTTN